MMGTVAGARDTQGLTFQDKARVLWYPDQAQPQLSPQCPCLSFSTCKGIWQQKMSDNGQQLMP